MPNVRRASAGPRSWYRTAEIAVRGRWRFDDVATLLLALGLTVLDTAATYVWLHAGVADEGNPLVRSVMAFGGIGGGLSSRALLGASLLLALFLLLERSRTARVALPGVTTVLAGLAIWHVQGVALLASA